MRAGVDPYVQMWRLIIAFRVSRIIGVAVELGIPTFLSRQPHTSSQLAADTKTHEPSLRRLLRAMVAMELVSEDAEGRFSLSPLGEELGTDRLGPFARFMDGPINWQVWGDLDHSIKTGERAFDHLFGIRNWDYYASHPEHGVTFDAAMRSMTEPVSEAVAINYNFSDKGKIADIGGGDGTMLIAILGHNPKARGLLFDRPDVVERARKRVEESGIGDRVDLVGGSFFEQVPSGADVYLMKWIIHDWSDGEAIAIMKICRAAADHGASPLLLVERMLSDRIGPDDLDAVLSDLNMLVNAGGRERTQSEYAQLLESAGYRLERTIPIGFSFHILEAIPV